MHKLTSDELRVPAGGWIAVGDASAEQGAAGRGRPRARAATARWSLRFDARRSPSCATCRREWLYRAPLPRTKLTSPAPAARFDGVLELAGRRADRAATAGRAWSATTGAPSTPSAGSGCTASASQEAPEAWLDVALGRVKVAGRLTPWVANGALVARRAAPSRSAACGARGLRVAETRRGLRAAPAAASAALTRRGARRGPRADAPPAGATPTRDGGEHDVVNCSIAALDADRDAARRARRRARCAARTAAPTSSACASATTASRSRRSPTADAAQTARDLSQRGTQR